ncbi:MAG: hypothetical protein IH872_10100 [Chloroflexi bacterium]|nr:hypothetical protein [Chloroflexota bacterium]
MGGSAREWSTIIDTESVLGGTVQLRLVMTKFGSPDVRIGYEIVLEPDG